MAINWETCPICYGGDVDCPDNCDSEPPVIERMRVPKEEK